MRKRNRLYTANKWNQPLFADVDRTHQNIFDGQDSSSLARWDRLASNAYGANYGDSGNTLNDYMNSKGNNWFGLSKQNNPFSKGNIGTTMKGIGGAAAAIGSQVNTGDPRGLYDTLDPVYHLAGGRESGVGNALSDTGVGLFNAGAQSGNGWLMLAGAGAKVLGGLTNAAFGVKENKNNVETIKANSALARMTGRAFGNVSNENDFWNLASNLGSQSNFKWNDLYKNGWLTKKGKKKGNALIADDNSAMAYQTHNMVKAAEDIDSKMDEIAFANSYAFGGPLGAPMFGNTGMGAIDYGFMSDYLTAKNKQAENKNTASNPFAGVANNFFSDGGSIHIKHPGRLTRLKERTGKTEAELWAEGKPEVRKMITFARNARAWSKANGGKIHRNSVEVPNFFDFGGDMQTNSADFSTGLTHISAGGSHEESPYDGVQLGVDSEGKPNLVEEGEVIFNDYVFSDRIPIDDETKKKFHFPKKRDITYAEAAKKLEKEISERPNDPISKASFNAQMQQLEEQQERQKQEMEAARAREAFEALSPEEQAGVMRYAQQQEQAAQEQAMQQEAMAQQAQMQQPSPEEIAVAEQQQGQPEAAEEQPVMAEGGHLYPDGGKKNVGTWKDDKADHWGIFTKPGLRRFLENAKAQIDMAPDDKKDEVRRKIMNDFNTLQQSYNDYVAPTLGSDRYEYSEGILNHQKDFDRKYGNTGFYSTDDNGNITNLIADAINLPQGAATEDKPSNWYDGYNGPRTSIRNFGSTEYGNDDYYKDLVEGFGELGLTYAPNENWKYGPDGNYQLYGLSIPEGAATAGEAPARRWDYNTGTWTTDAAPAPAVPSVATPTTVASNTPTADEWDVAPNYKNDKLRYAGLFGPAVGLGMQLMGIGKPDTGAFDNILEGYDRSGAALADYQPIGNYLRYNPMDIWFEQNRLNANARATDRAILNSGSNQGSKAAALLANGYNTQTASGDLYRKGLEYNDALRQQVAGFNRGTDQFNAEAYNRTALQNAETLNRQRQYRAQLGMQAAAQKADLDAGWYNGIYGNVAGLFKGIGDLGRENAQHNMIAEMAADGIFGSMSPRTNTGRRGKYLTFTKKAACGGKLNKKNGGK